MRVRWLLSTAIASGVALTPLHGLPPNSRDGSCSLQVLSPAVQIADARLTRLTEAVSFAPGCKSPEALDFAFSGEFADAGRTPFSVEIHAELGPSVSVDNTVSNILSSFSGRLEVGSGSKLTAWTITQNNFGAMFPKTILNGENLNFVLPSALQEDGAREPVYSVLKIGCTYFGSAVECNDFRFILGDAPARSVRGLRRLADVCPASAVTLQSSATAQSRMGLRPPGKLDCCYSAFRCTCHNCTGAGGPTPCPSLCQNCGGDDTCSVCNDIGCSPC